jgi:hypothetical protein
MYDALLTKSGFYMMMDIATGHGLSGCQNTAFLALCRVKFPALFLS